MSWTAHTSPFGNVDGYTLQFASNDDGSVIVAAGSAGQNVHNAATLIRSTDNGATWAAASSVPSFDSFFQLQPSGALFFDSDNQLFVWACAYQTAAGFRIATSPDGDTWTQRFQQAGAIAFIAAAGMRAPAISLSTILVRTLAANANYCLTSSDSLSWTNHATSPATTPKAIAWSEPLALGILSADGGLWSTTDGINFSAVTLPTDIAGGGWVIWSDTHAAFYALGSNTSTFLQVILKSSNGSSWTVVKTIPDFQPPFTIGELADGSLMTGGGSGVQLGQPGGLISQDAGASWMATPFFPGYGLMFAIHSTASNVNLLGDQPQDASHLTAIWTGTPIRNARRFVGKVPTRWKILIADLDGTGITDYSKLATNRYVERVLNAPLKAGGTVPSESPQVWIPFPTLSDDPYLAEGTRLMWWFRKESFTPPFYTVRAATLVQLVEDAAEQDTADTTFTGYDPWHYMLSRPVVDQYGELLGPDGYTYTNEQASFIIGDLLARTIQFHGHAYIDAGATYLGTGFYGGTDFGNGGCGPRFAQMETAPGMQVDGDFNIQQGTSVGQAWQQLTDAGYCDILLDPIYDPFNRPNYLVEMSVVAQAGCVNNSAIFAWNLPGRNLIALTRTEDGSQRANEIAYFAGQGGVDGAAPVQSDAVSIAKYGEYWSQRFFPQATDVFQVEALAAAELEIRKDGRTTVVFTPDPTRGPSPWVDYGLGDRCPVWASKTKFRKALSRL